MEKINRVAKCKLRCCWIFDMWTRFKNNKVLTLCPAFDWDSLSFHLTILNSRVLLEHLKYFDSVLKELQRSLTYLLPLLDLHVDNKKIIYLSNLIRKKTFYYKDR
jgi:hypothetical protein